MSNTRQTDHRSRSDDALWDPSATGPAGAGAEAAAPHASQLAGAGGAAVRQSRGRLFQDQYGGGQQPAHLQVDDKVNDIDAATAAGGAVSAGIAPEDYPRLLEMAERRDLGGFRQFVSSFSPDYRARMKNELIRHHKFDGLPLAMQAQLAPESPFHQESKVDAGGEISCTTAVRIEGVTAEQALAALTRTNWKEWWASSSTSGVPPVFDFVPEAPLAAIPGFHLRVEMAAAIKEGKNYRLPARLVGSFSGPAEMFIESVEGGVVVHDTWIGMKLANWTMEHAGGAKFWTGGHLDALRGDFLKGVLGPTGFAGLRRHLLAQAHK